ncbi:MAG: prepilin-type N-terminal cleavage/methylation domain-containing protein [Candidatus Omnitrophica bacterium]|nr:prepilin-type N-terminal cleavage/methylation domain-containing protein [Candidatus Omnitrophota bacterium]MDD5611109.1 prepilin-type N-terminal cleavage/methylation domain-containing protein [Candidatus Omnitrophota bacterium]
MRKGFTLLELLIVIIIIGVLAVVALTQYKNLTERARSSEAKAAIGSIRTAEKIYHEDHGAFTGTMDELSEYITPLPTSCQTTNWFSYALATGGIGVGADAFNVNATRCQTGGKTPNSALPYWVYLAEDSTGIQTRQSNVSGLTATW